MQFNPTQLAEFESRGLSLGKQVKYIGKYEAYLIKHKQSRQNSALGDLKIRF